MNKTNVKANPSTTHRHDTPNNKTHIIKFRVTETEKMELQCTAKLLDELADLTAFRLNAEKVLGELYGNAQAYRL